MRPGYSFNMSQNNKFTNKGQQCIKGQTGVTVERKISNLHKISMNCLKITIKEHIILVKQKFFFKSATPLDPHNQTIIPFLFHRGIYSLHLKKSLLSEHPKCTVITFKIHNTQKRCQSHSLCTRLRVCVSGWVVCACVQCNFKYYY